MKTRAWLLIIAYGLATMLAHVAHDHGEASHHAPETLAECLDGGVHFAAHTDAPDLSHAHQDCNACLFRGQAGTLTSFPSLLDAGPSGPVEPASSPRIAPTRARRGIARAPPNA